MTHRASFPAPYRAFIGTLFLFIFVANWSSLIPGVEPPTAHLETDAALGVLVFLSVIWFGIRAGGVRGSSAQRRAYPACGTHAWQRRQAHRSVGPGVGFLRNAYD